MTSSIQEILDAMKRTINGDPYPASVPRKYSACLFRIADMHDPREGSLVGGKFRVQKRLGKGAMAVVYKAVQEPIERVVALKIMNRAHAANPLTVKRFQREAKTLSALKHRNILGVHDIGETDDGEPFFAMEFLDGQTLDKLIEDRGAVPIARAVPIFCQICDGLEHAHKLGIIHRDLKPANIMLLKHESGNELVKLVDFGIVKIKGQQRASQKLTLKGEVWGSPIYMSPEQCKGAELDARSDVYSMAMVMYETLTGMPAISGENIGEIVRKQLIEYPPAFKDANALLRIPEPLEQIVFKSMAKNIDDRFPSMSALKAALESFAKNYGIKLPAPGSFSGPIPTSIANEEQAKLDSASLSASTSNKSASGSNFAANERSIQPRSDNTNRFNYEVQTPGPSASDGFESKTAGAHVPNANSSGASESSSTAKRSQRFAHRQESIQTNEPRSGHYGSEQQSRVPIKLIIAAASIFLITLFGIGAYFAWQFMRSVSSPDQKLQQAKDSEQDQGPKRERNPRAGEGPKPNEKTKHEQKQLEQKQKQEQAQKSPDSTSKENNSDSTEQGRESARSDFEKRKPSLKQIDLKQIDETKKQEEQESEYKEGASEHKEQKSEYKGQTRKPKQQAKKQQTSKTKQTGPKPEADEAMMERIYLKKHRRDDTQKWLDIQEKVSD